MEEGLADGQYGRFALSVLMQSSSLSTAIATSKPAASNPRSRPPAPVNIEINLQVMFLVAFPLGGLLPKNVVVYRSSIGPRIIVCSANS